ncbi:MAG: sodium-dependent bicarbonate transport family permease, partial [Flavobacteriales bacterium]
IITSERIKDLKKVGLTLIAFGVAMPLLSATLGILTGFACGLSQGGTTVLAAMAASASYIAAPAAMRIALPEANPTFSLTAALGITFPFNVILGIPLYSYLTALFY